MVSISLKALIIEFSLDWFVILPWVLLYSFDAPDPPSMAPMMVLDMVFPPSRLQVSGGAVMHIRVRDGPDTRWICAALVVGKRSRRKEGMRRCLAP